MSAVPLRDARDKLLLRGEVEVEGAGAHLRLAADVLHRCAMEPGPGKAALGGVEDVLATGGLSGGLQLRHLDGPAAAALGRTNRTNTRFRLAASSGSCSRQFQGRSSDLCIFFRSWISR